MVAAVEECHNSVVWAIRVGIGRPEDESDPYVFWLDWIGNSEDYLINCRVTLLKKGESITSVKMAGNTENDLVTVEFIKNDGSYIRSGPEIGAATHTELNFNEIYQFGGLAGTMKKDSRITGLGVLIMNLDACKLTSDKESLAIQIE